MSPPSVPLAAIRQPAFLYDAGGRIVEANDRVASLAGRPLAGCTIAEVQAVFGIRPPGGAPCPLDELPVARALRGEEAIDVPLAITAADGRTLDVLATASPIRDGDAVTGALVVWQDVTDLVAAENALREGEGRFRLALTNAPTAVFHQDRELRYTWYGNPHPPFAETDLIGKTDADLMAPEDAARIMALKAEVLATGEARRGEVSVTVDGATTYYDLFVEPVRDAEGRTVGVMGVSHDITGRKQTEEVEARLRSLLDHNPCLVFLKDEAGRYIYLNETYERQFVHSADWAGKTDYDFWPAESAALFQANDAEILRSGRTRQFLEDSTDLAGTRYCWLNYKFPFTDAQGKRYVGGVGIDATALVRTEEALRRSEEEYRHIVEHAPTGIFEIDYTGPRFRRVNDAMCAILGYTREELLAMDPGALLDEESRARFRERVRKVLAGEPLDPSVAFRLFAKDGREIWGALEVKPTFTDGRMDGALVVAHDVTERRRMEEALRETAARFQEALDSPLSGFAHCEIVTDSDGAPVDFVYLDVNPTFETFTGLSRERVIGRRVTEILVPDEVAALIRLYGRVALSGEPATFQYPIPSLGKWYEVAAFSPRRGQFMAYFTDITERKETEEALRESERRYRELVDSANSAIIRWRADGTVTFANTYVEALFGYGPGELLGRDVRILVPERDSTGADLTALVREVVAQPERRATNVNENVRRDGSRLWMLWTNRAILDEHGEVAEILAIGTDVTEQRRAEAALAESEVHLARAQEIAHVGSWAWEIGSDRLFWSDETFRILGLRPGEIPSPRNEDYITFVHPDDRERVGAAIRDALANGRYNVEFRFVRRDGGEVYAHSQGAVTFADGGTPVRMEGTVQDITERKEAEEALREYARNLARSNEDLERFAYVSSHDLQEPLRSIISFSQLLERRYRGRLDADADDYIAFIVEGGTRMQALIQDLLAYSRVNTTRQQFSPTDTADVLASVERGLDLQLREVCATLTHDPMPVVMADPIQLEQVFANLVSNAIKFRREGEPLRIHIGARRTAGAWEFSVADNGIGIEPEYFEKIFVIFQRLHTKETYPGTGIGLAIVKRIVDRHGGTIRVESTPGEGSTFFFTLPAA